MAKARNRIIYSIFILLVIILGLGSRHFSDFLPKWVHLYLGDTLWALMIFFIFGFLFKRKNTFCIATVSLLFSFLIEISQLYQAQWINTIRNTTIGGLVLGYGFLWSDLLAYIVGIVIGILLEKHIIFKFIIIKE
ncbi:ribosomal maturation YjgA family protein [Alkaliphilus sp. B6464]|uniref:ribosomal maturation YjgA family protein n=1 Tax=Alkaliphilus sp. B6464 TaxID=2731219 RepID=UPI001BA95123|nr:DUF2809 domain-containing protein [Alkaliphilus sp. B6464]QUH21309.1 DUF2809 domain-containing protein [Alkaliphilus sp. B6464]